MTKKELTTPELIVYWTGQNLWTDIIGASKEGDGGDDMAAPVRQTTDFFGNTVFVPIDDDWE